MSSPVMYLNLLLRIPPNDILFDFLAQCGLSLHCDTLDAEGFASEKLQIAAAIELAPTPVRDCILASLHQIALLADEAGLVALRAASAAHPGRVNSLHLPDAPAQCALWMYLRHHDLFDEATRMRGLQSRAEPLALDSLRKPLTLPDDPVVDSVRLYEATLLDETTGGEIAIKAPAGDAKIGVLDLLEAWIPNNNPMCQDRFQVVSAKVGVTFFPEPGRAVGRSLMLTLKCRGGSNLNDFDPRTREQLGAWLNRWRLTPGFDSQFAPSLPTTV